MINYQPKQVKINKFLQKFLRNVVHRYRILFSKFQVLFLRLQGAELDKTVMIYGKIKVVGDVSNLSVGANTKINDNVIINCLGRVIIGERVHLSSGCQIHSSSLGVLEIDRVHKVSDIIINDDVWICAGAIILKGVIVGAGSIVSANSVVGKPIPGGVIFKHGKISEIIGNSDE